MYGHQSEGRIPGNIEIAFDGHYRLWIKLNICSFIDTTYEKYCDFLSNLSC